MEGNVASKKHGKMESKFTEISFMIYKEELPPLLIISGEFYSVAFLMLDTEVSVTKNKNKKKSHAKITENFLIFKFFSEGVMHSTKSTGTCHKISCKAPPIYCHIQYK